MFLVKQKGLSLVELMVAMLLGLVLMAGVLQVFLASKRTSLIRLLYREFKKMAGSLRNSFRVIFVWLVIPAVQAALMVR